MGNKVYTGNAIEIAQVVTVQVTAYDASTTYKLTVNGVEISAAGDTDADTTATNLAAAWEASSHPYFTPITATAATDTVTLTGPVGMPFTVTSSVSGGTGTIGSATTSTAASGPHHYDDVDNWSPSGVPTAADDVFITKPDAKVLWGLDQSSVSITSLTIRNNPTIGLPSDRVTTDGTNGASSQSATEYRDHYLKVKATTVKIGEHLQPGNINGTRRCKIDNSITTASTTTIHHTGTSALESDLPAVRLLFADADADVFVRQAEAGVGIAVDIAGETSTVGDIDVSDDTVATSLFIGEGVTLSTYKQTGGLNVMSAAATVTSCEINGGELKTEGDFTITTVTIDAGELNANHIKTAGSCITTLTQNGGTVDFQQSGQAQTVGTHNFNKGTLKRDDQLTITTSNKSGRVTETVA